MDTKAKILVVDDDKEIADLVEIHLVSEGYVVRKANDAVTGLAMLKADEDISLAILDIMMPGMDVYRPGQDSGTRQWCRRLCDQAV